MTCGVSCLTPLLTPSKPNGLGNGLTLSLSVDRLTEFMSDVVPYCMECELMINLMTRRVVSVGLLVAVVGIGLSSVPAHANQISTGKITGKTVAAGVLSLLIWPGIGQAVNATPGKKVATHAILGLVPPYRFWSRYDALVDRKGGYWEGRI
jgi:hypothetical protein